jgi:lactate dehydrogenase-like 2-hydroxyacid dehydrogenase
MYRQIRAGTDATTERPAMTRPTLISIGPYDDWDLDPMQVEYDMHPLAGAGAIGDLPADVRAGCRAVAFKGFSGAAPLDAMAMAALPQLQFIANYGVGYDSIDIDAASARDIRVTNTPDVLNDDVADLAVALALMTTRDLVRADAWARSGDWAARGPMPLTRKFFGRRAGIVGMGRIGRAIADRLAAFKMPIHYHSRSPKPVPDGWTYHADPVDLASASDFLFVALVGGAATAGYVSEAVIGALGSDGVIVNISRGSTIDEAAMIAALEGGRLRGAGLDVFQTEPAIDPRLARLDNVVLAPHVGSATAETRQAMGQLQRDNLAAFFAGRPLLTPVN